MTTLWPRLLTGNSSVTPWRSANTIAWNADTSEYHACMSGELVGGYPLPAPPRRGEGDIVVLAGGVGAARFLRGLTWVVDPADLVVVGNTGDDLWWHGLYVAPDLDTVTYWLAGRADEER